MQPDLIKELKKVALDDDTTAYQITEIAVSNWLAERKSRKRKHS